VEIVIAVKRNSFFLEQQTKSHNTYGKILTEIQRVFELETVMLVLPQASLINDEMFYMFVLG